LDLAILQFPSAFSPAEALCSDIDSLGAVGKDFLYHLNAATGGQQLIHGTKSSLYQGVAMRFLSGIQMTVKKKVNKNYSRSS
jgi:hypothetical protein